MHPERHEYRLIVSNVDRGVSVEQRLVLSRYPAETVEHLTLRVLTFALLWEERLGFGPGVPDGDAPDLVARDLTGKVSTWIAVGDVSPRFVRKVVQHNRDAAVHVVFTTAEQRDAFTAEVASWGGRPPRGWDRLALWIVDGALVDALAAREPLRQRWTVTVVGEQIYVEADGVAHAGPMSRG